MTAEPLSYSARLKQCADLSAVIRLADSFLDLWADDAAEGSDEERAELAKARAEFAAVRPLVEAAPMLLEALQGMIDIASDSTGVAGYHQNGEVAEWGDFAEWHAGCAAIAKAGGQ